MKTYYDTSFKVLMNKKYLVFTIFVIGIICGTFYAIFIKEDPIFFFALNHYTSLERLEINNFELIKYSWLTYSKKILLIWLSGLFTITFPIGLLLFFIISFAYGFTSSCFILLYGAKGVVIAFLALGIQSILLILLCLYTTHLATCYQVKHYENGLKQYVKGLLLIALGVTFIACFDGTIQPLLQRLMYLIIA